MTQSEAAERTRETSPPAAAEAAKPEVGEKQGLLDRYAAQLAILYLLLMLALIGWFLFDTWVGRHSLASWGGYELTRLDTPSYRLVVYTVIGGAVGGIINGLRSALHWHGEGNFTRPFIWKYIAAPWLGAALALFVYAVLASGVAVLGGEPTAENIDTGQVLAMFAIGALAGYGSRDVFVWLDDRVSNIFKTEGGSKEIVEPDQVAPADTETESQDQEAQSGE